MKLPARYPTLSLVFWQRLNPDVSLLSNANSTAHHQRFTPAAQTAWAIVHGFVTKIMIAVSKPPQDAADLEPPHLL